ncbi:MAG TPA: outer membrane protein assembly factor BamD [Acidobacteriaceae bacterium]|nr:outer membrane protein assembly factor BamD [Acidobacteriaceae bacterium]
MKLLLPEVFAACLLATLTAPAPAGVLPNVIHHKAKPAPKKAGDDSVQPDKELYDKAMDAMKKGKFDVARLDLQTLLTTYQESEYQMKAKLAVGDSWFREGGSASLAQAEAEYKDFITFFPNQPEAAEAQMRVGDIYFMQMEKADRDPANAERAEEEYRTMIQQYPDSTLIPKAKQKLREVQEVLAERQFDIGAFYASREQWTASIARLQTVTDQYPLFSRSDAALIQLGDDYRAEARYVQGLPKFPEAARQDLMKAYDDRAADAYARVVTNYSMSPRVEDARERLIALNRPMPEPTPQQLAASEALEQSRPGVTLKDRALALVKTGPNTVDAAHAGEPTIVSPPDVNAPQVNAQNQQMFAAALTGKPIPTGIGQPANNGPQTASNGAAPAASEAGGDSGQTLELESVPAASRAAGPSIGASIVQPGDDQANASSPAPDSSAPASSAPPATAPASDTAPSTAAPATGFHTTGTAATDPGAATAAAHAGVAGAENPGGLESPPPANAALPPVEKPAAAPPQINDVQQGSNAQVNTGTSAGKKTPKYDAGTESSSKHKKKKGLDKINPF